MKRILILLAALALAPAVASADDLSATLSGNGQGFASIVTGNGSVGYTIVTSGIGTPNQAVILVGNSVVVDLAANFSNGVASGTTNTNADLAALSASPGNFTLRVSGPGGTVSGALANAGPSDGGGGGGGGDGGDDCPAGYFTSDVYPDFCFDVTITAGGEVQQSQLEDQCIAETLCISGAIPGRSELFIRIIGPRPNGFLWPTLVRFTPSEVTVAIYQISTEAEKVYTLDEIPPGVDTLDGLQDRTGFSP